PVFRFGMDRSHVALNDHWLTESQEPCNKKPTSRSWVGSLILGGLLRSNGVRQALAAEDGFDTVPRFAFDELHAHLVERMEAAKDGGLVIEPALAIPASDELPDLSFGDDRQLFTLIVDALQRAFQKVKARSRRRGVEFQQSVKSHGALSSPGSGMHTPDI